MLDNNYLRIALFLVGAFVLYQVYLKTMSSENGVPNSRIETMCSTSPMQQAFGDEMKVGSAAVSGPESCPKIFQAGMPKKVSNCQVQSVNDPTCDYEMLKNNVNVLPYPQLSNNYAPQMDVNQQFTNSYNHQQVNVNCFPKDQLTAEDLLPREDGYNTWQEVNPQAQGHLTDQNFLEAGHHFGINTVGQSLKNANLQLRSDPVIPQVATGPWQQSSYGPDTNRRFFEIGQC